MARGLVALPLKAVVRTVACSFILTPHKTHNMKEIWKDIEGYEGLYQVSDLGRVKSLKFGKERILKQNQTYKGYLVVTLSENGKTKTRNVHVLVAMAFLDHKPDGTQKVVVDHIDNNKNNNTLDNMQLISHRENVSKDRYNETGYTGVYLSHSKKTLLGQEYVLTVSLKT